MELPNDESSADDVPDQASSDNKLTLPQAGCLFLILSPLIAFVGAMRWNITHRLDADLAIIISWFCDTALMFLLLLPFAATKTKSWILDKVFGIAAKKLLLTVWIFYCVAMIVFVGATLAAFHYLIGLLFTALFG